MWFRPDTDGINRDLLELSEQGYTDYLLMRVNSSDQLYLRIEDADVGLVNLTSVETIDTGVWHHLVVTQDGTGVAAWLDGAPLTLTGTNSASWTAHLDANELFLGKTRWAALEGAMDEVVIDEVAWTAEQVAIDGRLGLVSRFPMDEGSGDVADAYTNSTCTLGTDVSHDVVDGVPGLQFGGGLLTCDVAPLSAVVGSRGSIALWARVDDLSRDNDLLNLFEDGYQNYVLLRRTAAGRVLFSIEEDDAEILGAYTNNGVMSDTDWHHIAVVNTGVQAELYIDGVASSIVTTGTGWTEHLSLSGLWVGGGHWSRLEGSVSDLRLYDRALRAAEVAELAQ